MACHQCGFKLREDDKYCPNCGARAQKPEAPRQEPASNTPQAAPSAPVGESQPAPQAASGPKQADPEIHKAREEFIREFVATLPAPEEPYRGKPGQLLKALTIVLCTAAEILIIGDIIISVYGIGPSQWHFAPVYAVSALICVVLIELALLLSVSVVRHKKRQAARAGARPSRVPALPPARMPAVSGGEPGPKPGAGPQLAPAPAPHAAAPPAEPTEKPSTPVRETLSQSPGADAPEGGSQKGPVQVQNKTEGPYQCKMTFTLRGEQESVVLTDFPAVIGRDIITDGTVSQIHCALHVERGVMTVRDLESANGVYVNGIRISAPTVIEKNDRVIIGRATVHFELV